MNKLFLTIGLPGSGKSVKAKELAKEYNAVVFSSDELREEMFGDVNDQSHNQELFVELHKRIKNCLRSGKSAIYDACNINYKRRMAFLAELKSIPCEKIAILMATPYEECLHRNSERERNVPEEVVKRMYFNFNVPYWYEGWDDIKIEYSDGAKNCYGSIFDWVDTAKNYDQHNSHHRLSLGEHCYETYWDVLLQKTPEPSFELRIAALIHDCGKPSTATFINSKGEETDECHYYNHQYTGAYDSLFFLGAVNHLHVAILIQWHMHPYMSWKQSKKAKNHDRKMLGDELFSEIMMLHEADKNAH